MTYDEVRIETTEIRPSRWWMPGRYAARVFISGWIDASVRCITLEIVRSGWSNCNAGEPYYARTRKSAEAKASAAARSHLDGTPPASWVVEHVDGR